MIIYDLDINFIVEHNWLLHQEEDDEVSNILAELKNHEDYIAPLVAPRRASEKDKLVKYHLVLNGRRSSVMQSLRKLNIPCSQINGVDLEKLILSKKFPIPFNKWQNYALNPDKKRHKIKKH